MNSLRDTAYNYIREKIITCQYMPGSILDEKKLMEETGCGRTPVREALTVLANNGLVRIIPRRGMFVSQVTIKDIHDIYEFKREIEPMIIRSNGNLISRQGLYEFKRIFSDKELDYYTYSMEDDRFHAMIIEASDNRYYQQMMNIVSDQSQRIRLLTNVEGRLVESVQEHLEIIEKLLKDQYDQAADSMAEHYIKSLDNIMRFDFASKFIDR